MKLRLPIFLLLVSCFQLVSEFAIAQTTANCYGPYNPAPASVWGISEKFASNAVVWNGGTPTAADLDGDNISEILVPASDNSGYYTYKGNGSNKTTATKNYVIATSNARSVQPAIANIIGAGSSAPEVVMVNSTGFVYIFNNQGGTETNFLFKSTTASQYTFNVTPYIVDIDEDGTAEIVLGSDVFGIVNGALVKRVAGTPLNYVGATSGATGTAIDVVVVDIIASNPGKELVYGSRVYSINLSAGTMTILKDLSTIAGSGAAAGDNGPTAVADMDLDGDLDIVYNGSVNVYIWDPNQSLVLFKRIPPAFVYGVRGLPLIANVYNEKVNNGKVKDLPEALIINSSGGSSGIVTAYNLNFTTVLGSTNQYIWSLATNDMSGSTGITAFDFDGNGIREIIYRDQSQLRIINGNLATPVNYAAIAATSATWGEYPIVGDFDNDGQADIAVTGDSRLLVFNRAVNTFDWKGAPSYWNQRNYRIVNINPDLTVPSTENNAAGSAAINNNVAQLQFSDAAPGTSAPYGTTAVADASIAITSVVGSCPVITVAATISNSGAFLLPAGTFVAMYDANPTTGAANLIGTYQTTTPIAAGASGTVSMTANLVAPSSTIFAVVNDRGTTVRPFNLSSWTPNTGINECSYTNNMDSEAFTCLDTDGDSVVDYVDIDDDNDGVLDITEQSGSCTSVTLTPFSATSSPVYGGSTANRTIDGSGFTGTGLTALASAPAELENAWLLKEPETSGFIEYLMPAGSNVGGVALWAPDAFNYGGGDGPPKDFTVELTYEGGRIFTSQVFTTAQPNSSGALPGGQTFYFTKALSNVSKIRLNILSGWYDINNNSIGQISTDGIAVNAAYNMFLGEFRAICGLADFDTDNDGIPNRLDLDSDGDGCTDAVEAGVSGTLNSGSVKNGVNGNVTSTNTLPNAIAAGLYGTNGLANSLETTADNGVINYTSSYAYATLRGFAACADADGDGVNDVIDLDDDNDGILDNTELSCTFPLNAVTPTLAGATSIFSDNNTGTFLKLGGATLSKVSTTLYGTSIDVVQFSGTSSGAIVLANAYQQLKIAVADVDQSESINLKVYDVLGNLIQLSASNILQKGSYVNPTYPAGSSMVLTAAGALTYDGSTSSLSNILIEIPFTAKRIEVYKTAGSQNSWVGLLAGCNDGDTDNDGIPNRLDLDSDGDGCSDALESGATTSGTANFAFTGSMGSNGLVNSLETVADNGLITYTSTYDFAISKNYAACVDTDGDTVTDINDVDDDNDGILDAIESPTCFYTKGDWLSGDRSDVTVSTSLAMNATYGAPSKLVDGNSGTAAASYAVNFNASTTAAQTVFAFRMPIPVELKTIYLGYVNANTHFNTGTQLRIEGSNDNTSWTTLGTGYGAVTSIPGVTGTITANTFTVADNNRGKFLFYRIYWVSGGGVNATAYSNEVYFETFANYQPSLHSKLSCISDADGDGIPNHQDLDTDGDGCPDAREAGVSGTLNAGTISNKVNGVLTTTSNVVGAIANGIYGTNGFANALETGSENGIYSGTYSYQYARSSAVVFCTDSDGDGVLDLNDLDDDNDGVLDTTECPPFDINNLSYSPIAYTVTNGASASQTFPAAPDGLVVNVWTLDNSFNVRINGTHLTNPEELQFWPSGTTDAVFEFFDGTAYGQVWTIVGNKNKPLIRIYIDKMGQVKVYGSRTSGGALEEMRLRNGSFNTITLNANATNTFQIGQAVVAQTFISGDYGVITPPVCDDDNDGIPNGLDLDSDGDGCPDAKEAGVNGTLLAGDVENGANGAVTSTTNLPNAIAGSVGNYGANGLADVVETLNESGVIRYTSNYANFARSSTLSVCLDTDADGVADVLDIDDDNDGILDSIEQISCTGTGANLSPLAFSGTAVTTKTANTITASNTNAWLSSYSTENFSLPLSLKFKRPTIGNQAMFGLIPVNGTQTPANWNDDGYKFFFTSTNVNVPYGTTSNVVQTATALDEYSIDISVTGFVTIKINGIQKAAFQGVNSSYKLAVSGLTTTVFTDIRLSNPSNPLITTCTDTDNDGIPNYLDLDSDGDGCPDAKEASIAGTLNSGAVKNGTNGSVTSTTTLANSIAAGSYGANGFADALETSAESGIYSGIYITENVLSAFLNACTDSDTDGVTDLVDIDDDNDGVLDAVESPSCFYTPEELVQPIAISTELAPYSTYVIGNSIDGSSTTTSAFAPSVSWVNKELFKLTALKSIPISGLSLDLSTWALSNGTSNTFKLQGSNDNSAWTDLSSAVSSTATTGIFTLTNSIAPNTKFLYYRVIGVAGTSYYGGVTEIKFVISSSFNASQYTKSACTTGTSDGDTIPNHLDLDSDGDGCSDALEAGTTSSVTANFVHTTAMGANGFADGLETSENGRYTGVYTYYYANNAGFKICVDTDTDGVKDIIDVDDDNDGILDAVESPTCFSSTLEATIPLSLTSDLDIYNNNILSRALDDNASTFSAFNPNINWVNKEIFRITPNVVGPLVISGVKMDLVSWAISNGTSNTFKLQGSLDNGATWVDLSATVSSTQNTGSFTVSNTLNPTIGYSLYRIIGVAGVSFYGGVTELSLVLPAGYQASKYPKATCTRDTDSDTKFNHQDLDSDGDGCNDAKEAGLASNTTSSAGVLAGTYGANGFVDALETITDNGVYKGTYIYKFAISASENACLDTDSDNLGDLLDIDDDNDGILDTTEQTNCITSGLDLTTLTFNGSAITAKTINGLTTAGGDVWRASYSDQNLKLPISLSFKVPSTTGYMMFGLIPAGSTQTPTTWVDGGYKFYPQTTTVYGYVGSAWSFNSSLLPNDVWSLDISTTGFVTVKKNGTSLQAYQGVVSDYKVVVSAFRASSMTEIILTDANNVAVLTCTDLDTDTDGIPNRLDLDSDGDGCSDAVEAGSSTTATSTSAFPTGTDTNSNGLLNNYETGTTGTVNYTSTYTLYALSNAINACLDSDTDGVKNLVDLDDDNDGVLDAVESPSCFFSASDWNSMTKSLYVKISSELVTLNPNTDFTRLLDNVSTTDAIQFVTSTAQNHNTKEIFRIEFTRPTRIDALYISKTSSTQILGGNVWLQGSTDGTNWTNLWTAAANPVNATNVTANGAVSLTNSNKFTVTTNAAAYTYYRIYGAASANVGAGIASEFYFDLNTANYVASAYPKLTACTVDTDGDGIPNHLDLDSDGDGCSDAVEAKTVASLTATTVSGVFGPNGFADNLETSGNGVYTGTYVYSRATDPTVKACLDSDFDGVPDIDDLDDDNDGLLDAAECSAALMIENNPANLGQVSRKSWTLAYIIEQDVNSFAGSTFGALRSEATQNVYGEVKLPPASTPVIKEAITSLDIPSMDRGTIAYREVYVKIPSTAAFTNSSQISFRVGKDNLTWNAAVLYIAHNGARITSTTPAGGGGGSTSVLVSTNSTDMKLVSQGKYNGTGGPYYQGGEFITSPANAGKWVRMALSIQDGAINEQASVQYRLNGTGTWLPVDVDNGFQFAATEFSNVLDTSNLVCDTDSDGIPNGLDLDSDGDGCSDANEAYGSATAQGTDGNQQYGTNPITVDATGKVTGASYTATSVNVLTVGRATVITTQPADVTSVPGATNVSYSATVTAGSGTTAYQWQLSTNGGASWANITNNATYSGATTATLTLSAVTIAMKEYRYRLTITQSDFVCGNLTSSAARLIMNTTPVVVDDNATVAEDTPVTGNVLTNDKGSGNPAAVITVTNFTVGGVTYTAGQTANLTGVGTISIGTNGSYTFTPVANYNGTVPLIEYTATDANGGTDVGALNITVTPVNDPPLAIDDIKSTNENTAVTGNVLTDGTDDSDVDGNTLTITEFKIGTVSYNPGTTASIPGVGTIVVNTNGSYTFTPAAGYTGAVPAIDYTISDGNGGSDVGRLSITVLNVNDAPLATDDIVRILQNGTATGSVLTNDTDVDAGTTLSVTQFSVTINGTTSNYTAGPGVVTLTGVGTIVINTNGTYTFIPLSNYVGTVPPITYTLSDGTLSDTALLDIFVEPVNANPVAVDDAISTLEDTPVNGFVLTNDTDTNVSDTKVVVGFTVGGQTYPAGSTATIAGVGTIVMNSNGSYTFTPFANYNGTVPTVSYTVSDGKGGTDSGDLVISVTAVNDDPIAVNDDNKTTPEDTPVTVNVLTNDSDLDVGSTLTVTQFTIDGIVGTFTTTATIPGKGTLTVLSTGEFTFTPDLNFNGVVPRITYTVSDGVGTNTANLNLTVTPVNDPPTVVNETPSTPENTALSGNVLTDGTDDSDVDGNTLSISQFTISGTTYPAGTIVNLPNVGTVIVNADGTYTFTPVTGYFGSLPVITYAVSDGNGGSTNGTLAITVTPVNDPPVVSPESIQIQEDAPATGNLLTNDTDPENNTLTISQFTIAGVSGTFTPGTTAVTIPNVGTIQISANGAYVFTPAANYNGIVPNIEYTVSDGQGAFTNGNLTIVVAAVNDAPTVTNDTKTEPVNTPIVDNVLSNDRDIEGTALSLTKFTIGGVDYPAGTTATIAGVGTVVMNADGSYTFTPATNYVGSPPVITYTVSDGTATSTGTLSLTITPIDADGDGIPDATEKGTGSTPRDTDNDGTPDYLDTDSDNDGIPDASEDALCIGFLPCTPTDTDGDGTPDYRDLDSDGDGISDAIEGTTDTDGDGIPNYQDTDSDGDGILDSVEKGPSATPVDTDLDGTPDYRDLDSDGDGIPDATEGALDTDADGVPNFQDLDSDGDGILDAVEGTTDTDSDGTPNYLDTDSDGDGISDAIEKGPTATPVDTDGDGTPDYKDLDSDNDGILDSTETATDTDSDGIPNFRDLDSDGDGILDAVEGTTDSDGDGTPNYRDVDSDGDGIPDSIEKGPGSVPVDTDGDGTPDYLDLDTDGDGIPDAVEDAGCTGTAPCTPTDTDGDGTPNFRDLDSDGDGLTDAVEKGPNGATPVDTDGDTTPDYLDVDSDGDGISDAIEKGTGTTPLDTDGDGTPDYRDTDSDNDGILDSVEKGTGTSPVDTDNDGTPDYRDLDSDGDGKSDQSEGTVDTDNDGTPNYLDLDSDGDGVLDAVDVCPLINGLGSTNGCPPDSDGDGLADVDDSDDDNDGILDTVEAAACSPAAATCDTDGDGIPNILDTDSDGDGISDVTEAGGTDVDKDGKADGAPDVNGIPASASGGLSPPNTDGTGTSNPYDTDSDGDGILDAIEKGTGTTLADTDNDTIPDYLETDSDNDGISDAIEKGTGSAVADTDNDGIPDYRDLDSDGDGIPDSIEKGSGSTPVDTDGDGIPNFRDVDSDGDGILDSVEDAACSGITPCTPTDTDGDNTPDYLDLDSDADGIPDAIEGTVDTDRDGLPDYLDTDSDGDGILDSVEDAGCTGTMPCTPTDTDGDGIPNFRDLDSDGDGITDVIEGTTDTDGDLNPNYLDTDSDGDGISDLIEGNVDSDGDGTPNYKDLDSDGDGIPDAIEKGTTTAPVDTDIDGTPDYLDTDTDGDGIPDGVEDYGCTGTAPCTPTDTDGDGIPNHKDLDSDNDGIPDSVEKGSTGATPEDTDGTGLPNYLDTDSDDDGILDAVERGIDGNNPLDTDGDGTPDYKEVDSDGDGISDAIEGTVDTDGDGIPNYRDTDSDNDGILDSVEKGSGSTPVDTDSDGTPDYKDLDSDGDNKSDQSEGISDFDGDGTPNYLDLDSDGDGVLDIVDQCPLLVGLANLNGCPVDTDADGIYDIDDLDDDNDGLLDTVEAAACSPTAADCDTDGDGIPNRIDPDSDNDGISDVRESNGTDVDGDGRVDGTVDANGVPSSTNGGLTPPNTDGTTLPDPYDTDSDGDGIPDSLERGPNPNAPVDTDGDGTPDYRDLDSDGDGIPDSVERGTGAAILDTDGDGTPDYKDLDSDNDGIQDTIEKGPNGATPLDTDGDGIPNYRDLDSDGDGIPDSIEKGTGSTLLNSDGDALPDYLDTDSDGDGISDAIEKGLNGNSPIDTDGDGTPDYRDTDSDNDGIPDSVEKGTGTTPVDTDGDGVPNYRDLDSDGDGITDAVEKGANGATPVDTDSDGSPDYVDLDADGDGKLDAIEKGTGSTLLDTDRDGIPDYRDVDNYGQPDVNVTDVNVPVVGNVKTNDAVPAGTTYGQPAAIAGATLVMNPATGTYTFTSATPGTYEYFVPVCGPNQTTNCPLTPLLITVLDPLTVDKPVANTDFAILEQGGSATVAILANDKTGDLGKTIDATSLVILTAPAHGTAVVNSDGTITYTPSPFFVGVDSLEYRVCDTNNPAQCQTATVYFTVEPAGLVVKTGAVDDFAIVRASPDGSANVTGNLLSNDLNGAGATLTANLVTGPTTAQGTFTLNANGTYSFTPAPGFSGPVDIVYEACGGSPVVCTKATLHILVEPMPTLVNDTNSAFANVPKAGDLSTNDTKPAGTTYGQPAQQAGATLTVNADGTYSITATAVGTYTYTIPVCAPGQVGTCPTQTLVVTVTAPSPVNDTNSAFANVPKAGDLSTNDTKPAGTTYGQPAQQAGATLTVNADGTYSITATAVGTYTYTIPVCAPGQVGTCPTQTLVVTVTAPSPVNDTNTAFANVPKTGDLSTSDTNPAGTTYGQPAQQAGATLTVNTDGTYSITATAAGTYTYTIPVCAPGQTLNCPTQTLTITVTAPSLVNDTNTALANVPKTGNLSTNDTNPAGSTYGQPAQQAGATLTVNTDGTYSFTATAAGTYTYTVPVCAPGQTANCPTQTLVITVTAPSLVNDTNTAFANVPKAGDLATNDTNPAGTTYGQPAQQAGATLTVNADGTYSFTATAAGTYTYTIPVCAPGQTLNCPTQTLEITVTAPSLVNDTNTAFANVPKTGNLSTNDTNPAGSTYGQPAQQAGATLTVNADGTYSFTATAAGTYTYTIPVCAPGQTVNCPTQTLEITVTAPSLVNDTNTAFANVPKTGNLSTNDTNPAGSTYGQPAQQTGATLTVNADGTYSFTATAAGTYTYTIPVCAPGQSANCPTQTLTITVTAPSLVNDTNTALANVPKTGNLSTNDTNPAGSTYGQPAQQTGATLTVNADGTYSFTATVAGTYTYTIPVCAPGQTANCPTQTLVITVEASSPTNDTNTAFANVPKTGDLSTNDTNSAGTTYGQPAQQTGATLTVNADGTYSFTATAVGTYTYTVPVCAPGQTANCPTQTLTITVTAPSLVNDTDTALANVPKTGNLSTNDTNPAGSTYGQPAQQAGATLTVNADGTYSFTGTVAGTYTYTVPVCAPGQTANCPTQILVIKVTGNDLVAGLDNFQSNQINGLTGGIAGNVLANDALDGKPIIASQVVITIKNNGGLTGVVIDKEGNLILPAGVAPGSYVVVYTICDVLDPTNCREAMVMVEVFLPVDLKVTKSVEAPEWFEGDEFTYTLRVENTGKTAATSVVVTDMLPLGLRYVSLVSSQIPVTTQVRGQEITFNITQLPIAGSTDITLKVKAAPLADGKEQTLLNTVSVTSKGREMSPADNTSSVPVLLKAFFIPNTITPNGGGINDTFEIPGLGRYVSNELVIMNRWGDEVFERKNYQNDWGAEGLVSGTYFYILKVTDEDGKQISFKGFVEVVKERIR